MAFTVYMLSNNSHSRKGIVAVILFMHILSKQIVHALALSNRVYSFRTLHHEILPKHPVVSKRTHLSMSYFSDLDYYDEFGDDEFGDDEFDSEFVFDAVDFSDEDFSDEIIEAESDGYSDQGLFLSSYNNAKVVAPMNSTDGGNSNDFLKVTSMNTGVTKVISNGSNIIQSSDPQIAYFYLRNTIGLADDAMWRITVNSWTVLGLTVANLKQKVALIRDTLDLSKEDIKKVISLQPRVLTLSSKKNIAPTMDYLLKTLNLTKSQLRTIVVGFPSILCYSKANISKKIQFFIKKMGYTLEECRSIVLSHPSIMSAGVKSSLIPKLNFLEKEMMIPKKSLRKIIMRSPRILSYSLDKNLRMKIIGFFIMRLHMEQKQIQRLLESYPKILDYSFDNTLIPMMIYFDSELGINSIQLRSIVLKFPRVVTHALTKMQYLVDYLRFDIGLDSDQLRRCMQQAPQILGLDTDNNLKGKVEFIRSRFELTDDELIKVIYKMPTILNLNVESNLGPKADFLQGCFEGDLIPLKKAIILQPALLGYSLNKRIQPRIEKMIKFGVSIHRITNAMTLTDANFDEWVYSGIIDKETLRGERGSAILNKDGSAKKDHPKKTANVVERHNASDRLARIVTWTRREKS